MPWGLYVGFEPPSMHTVLQCMRNGMLPKTYLTEKRDSGEWCLDHDWPVFGIPRNLVLDREMENIGKDMEALQAALPFNIEVCPRKSPWFKGKIERFLGTLNKSLLHAQAGTTFSNIGQRDDYDPEKNAVITLKDLIYQIHRWIVDIYSCQAHRGLMDVPMRAWEDQTVIYPVDPIEDANQLDLCLGRSDTRMLRRTGIWFENLTYQSVELNALLADPRFKQSSPNRDIAFRFDAGDLGDIRVLDPTTNLYFTVPCDDPDYARRLSLWQQRVLHRHKRTRMYARVDRPALVKAKAEMAGAATGAPKKQVGQRKRAARAAGVGRFSMAGGSHATEPSGATLLAARAQPPLSLPAPTQRSRKPTDGEIETDHDIYAQLGIERR